MFTSFKLPLIAIRYSKNIIYTSYGWITFT